MGESAARWWTAGVMTAAAIALLLAWQTYALSAAYPQLAASLLFGSFILLGEFFPVRVLRRGEGAETTIATSFALALVVTAGTVVATVAFVIASLVADVARRRPRLHTAFEAGRYGLSLTSAGLVFESLHGRSPSGLRGLELPFAPLDELGAITVAGVVFFFVSTLLAGEFATLVRGQRMVAELRRDPAFHLAIVVGQLAMTPVAVLVAQRSIWLVPLLLVPAVAVHRSARLSQEKEFEALHDTMTRLPNRALFHDHVAEALVAAPGRVAVLFIDLDRFREVNDTLGHHVGDRIIQQMGPRLRALGGPGTIVGRLGGDEFAMLLPAVADVGAARAAAERVAGAVAEPFRVDDLSLAVEANIGVAVHPDHAATAAELLQRADVALYVAKHRHSAAEVYDAQRGARSRRSLGLVGDLRRAIDERQLGLEYQPKAELSTGRISGVEALVRWWHPRLGLVPPDEFIPLAEHTVLMDPLTIYVLDEALSQCATWRHGGLDLRVAVNLSMRNLHDAQLPEKVAARLQARGLTPDCLELEITESSIMADPQRALQTLGELSALGVRLSIDDFGTGYSSLAYLKSLPVNEVKIDRSFLQGFPGDSSDAAIVRSTLDMARHLGLEVVAEGVETPAAWGELVALGCDYAQGRYLSPPLAAAAIIPALRAGLWPVEAAGADARP